jgi:transposase InsO family protein
MARCTVERLMRAEDTFGVVAKRARPRTTMPGDPATRPRDLVERDFRATAPNQLWVTEITYVELAGGGYFMPRSSSMCSPVRLSDGGIRQRESRVGVGRVGDGVVVAA